MSLSDLSQLADLYRVLSVHPQFQVQKRRRTQEQATLAGIGDLIRKARLGRFGAEFAGDITLLAFGREQECLPEIVFHFQWYAPRIRREWRVFFHFLDAQGEISFQGDYGLGDAPVDCWGFRYFRKTVTVPHDVPNGDYRMRLGVFSPEESAHLRLIRFQGCLREEPGWCRNAVLLGPAAVIGDTPRAPEASVKRQRPKPV